MNDLAFFIPTLKLKTMELIVKDLLILTESYLGQASNCHFRGVAHILLTGMIRNQEKFMNILIQNQENRQRVQWIIKNIPLMKSLAEQQCILEMISQCMELASSALGSTSAGNKNVENLLDSLHPILQNQILGNQYRAGSMVSSIYGNE